MSLLDKLNKIRNTTNQKSFNVKLKDALKGITKEIGERGWKGEYENVCSKMLGNKNDLKEHTGVIEDPNVFDFLLKLLSLRADDRFKAEDIVRFEIKIISGIGIWTHNTFFAIRKDGSTDKLGYKKCITNPSKIGEFTIACRRAIKDDTNIALNIHKSKYGNKCLMCQNYSSDLIVHHDIDYKFSKIAKEFMSKFRNIGAVISKKSSSFKDEKLNKMFSDFHNERAKLVVICVECHNNIHHKNQHRKDCSQIV